MKRFADLRSSLPAFLSLVTSIVMWFALSLGVSASIVGCAAGPASDTTASPDETGSESNKSTHTLSEIHAAPDMTTVSGVSAGAYMATQLQIAYSKTFKGLGSVAGGPWNCSNGLWWNATSRCMETPASIDVATLLDDLKRAAKANEVDPLSNLRSSRVYLLNSPNDTVVRPPMAEKNAEFFGALFPAANIKFEQAIQPGHSLPTLDYGLACNESGSPFLSNCGFDTAGAILRQLYPQRLLTRGKTVASSLYVFDQSQFDSGGASLANKGYIYIPKACFAKNANCPLHVSLHGCSQGSDAVKDVFVQHAGFNEWAEGTGIIVLYPQTYARAFVNPKGCFDWFGYTGASTYATKDGRQMKAIKAMVDRLTR